MAFKQNNPLSRKTSPINKNWIKGAIKRPGAFKKKAEDAGMSTKAFANKVIANKEDYDSRTDKQAELAKTLMGMSRESSEQGDFDYEDPNYRNTPEYKKFKRKQKRKERKNKPKRGEAGFEQDPEEARYEKMSKDMNKKKGVSRKNCKYKKGVSRKSSPINNKDKSKIDPDLVKEAETHFKVRPPKTQGDSIQLTNTMRKVGKDPQSETDSRFRFYERAGKKGGLLSRDEKIAAMKIKRNKKQ